jgi:hypothetical protein
MRLFGAVDKVGGRRALLAHPHVKRAIAHKGKAPLRQIKLHR